MPDDAGSILQIVRRLAEDHETSLQTDARLLERFVSDRDETAFVELVRRHAGTVWRVCRCALRDPHAAEDAVQATFLVLFRKARGIGRPDRVSNWLYGVALKVARRARKQVRRRAALEVPMAGELSAPCADEAAGDYTPLHEEIQRLPRNYRMPLALCYLDGLTNEEAARRLGWPVGTLKVRLMRAREALRNRLVRRGVCLASGGLPVVAMINPAALADTTAAAVLATGSGRAAGTAAVLANGVLQTMWYTKLSTVTAACVALAAVVTGTGWVISKAGEPVKAAVAPDERKGKSAPVEPPRDPEPPKAERVPKTGPAPKPPGNRPAPGGEAPITAARFSRAYVDAINNSHHWYFKGNRFVLAADAGGIPADLLKALLGPDRKADLVTGEWALDADRTHMVFAAIVADGRPGVKEAKIGVSPAGLMRVNLEGGGQYNATHFGAELPQPKGVDFAEHVHATKIDLAMLQGTWAAEFRTANGEQVLAADLSGEVMTVTGDAVTIVDKEGVRRGTIKLDAVPVPPTLDVTLAEGRGKDEKPLGTLLGVYELGSDRLKVHTGIFGSPRAQGLESKPGAGTNLTVFKRLQDGSAAADRGKLQGDWKVVSCKSGGKELPAAEAGKAATFDGDNATWDGEASTFKLTDAKNANHLDVTMLNDPAKPKANPAIYKFDEGRLVIHLANFEGTRPEGFESKPGADSVVMVLERVKK